MTPGQALQQSLETLNLPLFRLACRAGAQVSEQELLQILERALQATDANPFFPMLRELVEEGADPAKAVRGTQNCLELARQANRQDCYWVLVSAERRASS